MKFAFIIFLSLFSLSATPNKPVTNIDLQKFSGKWYSLYSIPTMFDKGSSHTVVNYQLNNEGYYDVTTTGKEESGKDKIVHSKLFPQKDSHNAKMKAQFLWPFKVDYWVIDVAPDYSWAVVGHPDHKFLFFISRKPLMDPKLHEELVAKCKAMGYPVNELVSQKF